MEQAFPDLHGRRFDAVVIGGGINGASVAQNLAAAGYSCLVADKGDFGGGASGRSARMLHPGLRYFEARKPLLHFGLHPMRLVNALRGARQAMLSVSEHLKEAGDRIWTYRMCFPVYRGDEFKSWHVRASLKLLDILGDGTVPFQSETVDRTTAQKIPFFNDFRNVDQLEAIACYNEFKFEWPERFCVDMLLDAERNGATLANYAAARLAEQSANGTWTVTLAPASGPDLSAAEVYAPVVLNMAGTWIDDVLPQEKHSHKLIQATKGTHIVVHMPETYQGFGVASLNSLGEPHYVLPLHKNLFSIGVTETLFEGDATDIVATDEEIDFLIAETNALLPGRQLSRADVVRSWAGVRPLTHSASEPKGSRARVLHDLEDRGFPGVYALTGGPIMTHRSAGRLVLDAVAGRLAPSGQRGRMDTTPFAFSASENSPAFLDDEPDVRVADLEVSVTREHARSLIDVLLRRTGLAWRREMTREEAERAARIIGPHLGWNSQQGAQEVARFLAFQDEVMRRPSAPAPPAGS